MGTVDQGKEEEAVLVLVHGYYRHSNQQQLGEERVHVAYTSRYQFITEGSQGRK